MNIHDWMNGEHDGWYRQFGPRDRRGEARPAHNTANNSQPDPFADRYQASLNAQFAALQSSERELNHVLTPTDPERAAVFRKREQIRFGRAILRRAALDTQEYIDGLEAAAAQVQAQGQELDAQDIEYLEAFQALEEDRAARNIYLGARAAFGGDQAAAAAHFSQAQQEIPENLRG